MTPRRKPSISPARDPRTAAALVSSRPKGAKLAERLRKATAELLADAVAKVEEARGTLEKASRHLDESKSSETVDGLVFELEQAQAWAKSFVLELEQIRSVLQ